MRIVFSLLLLFIFNTYLKAQTVQGKVINATTGEPISFASLAIIGTSTATVTNENGEFIVKVEKFPIKLRFSHVSYLQLETSITETQSALIIRLSPAAINLNEVVIRPNEGKNVLRSALLKAKQYLNTSFYANAFYRQLTSTNNNATEIHELFYDLNWQVKNIRGWAAKQSRFATLENPLTFSMTNQSFFTFAYAGYVFPDKRRRYVSIKYFDEYEIEIDRYIEQKDQDIAVITCKLKEPKKNSFYINSTYYVGIKDFKIYRLENKMHNLTFSFSPNISLKFPPIAETIATFNDVGDPITILESLSTKIYLGLSSGNRSFNSVISSLLTVIKIDDKLKNQKFKSLSVNVKDKKVIESIEYDAYFWKNNPIVKQTTLEDAFIKMMESKQAFGTMTNP